MIKYKGYYQNISNKIQISVNQRIGSESNVLKNIKEFDGVANVEYINDYTFMITRGSIFTWKSIDLILYNYFWNVYGEVEKMIGDL